MKYPYYIVPDVEKYRKLDPESDEAILLSRRIAANIGDYAALRLVLGIDPPEFAKFYPDMETPTPSTIDTIDSFLDKFGNTLPENPLDALNPDSYNLEESLEPPSLHSLLKNKSYSEALAFIESQNLNNPEKSIYFAHQIRFIKKLMAIENFKKKTKG